MHIRFPLLLEVIVILLMSYACVRSFHYIHLEIKLEQGLVNVLDSWQKDPKEYADMTEILEK